jgi:hypothetical protein
MKLREQKKQAVVAQTTCLKMMVYLLKRRRAPYNYLLKHMLPHRTKLFQWWAFVAGACPFLAAWKSRWHWRSYQPQISHANIAHITLMAPKRSIQRGCSCWLPMETPCSCAATGTEDGRSPICAQHCALLHAAWNARETQT